MISFNDGTNENAWTQPTGFHSIEAVSPMPNRGGIFYMMLYHYWMQMNACLNLEMYDMRSVSWPASQPQSFQISVLLSVSIPVPL